MKKDITLTVNGQSLHFCVVTPVYNKYVNELLPTNKVAPAENFLRRCVAPDDKDALAALLEMPSAAVQLAGTLVMEFMPDIEIEVGK